MLAAGATTTTATRALSIKPELPAAGHRAAVQPCSVCLPAAARGARSSLWRAVAARAAGSNGKPSPPGTTAAAPPSSSSQGSPSSSSSGGFDSEEARIEALEASTRKAKGKASAARQIPIRGMTPRNVQDDPAFSTNRAPWKEGQLFPEGWEGMSATEKVTELYLGRRGILFWSSQLAWYGAISLGVAWALFRIGGAMGLYQLTPLI